MIGVAEDILLAHQVKLMGSESAFERLVEKYQSPIRRYLTQLTGGNRSLADDLAQETFIKAYTRIGQFGSTGSFKSWLYSIAYHQFLDNHRRRVNTSPVEALGTHFADSHQMSPLDEALGCLTDSEKNVILLSAVEQLSHGDISKMTDMPLGTVKSTIARAKDKLKVYLSRDY